MYPCICKHAYVNLRILAQTRTSRIIMTRPKAHRSLKPGFCAKLGPRPDRDFTGFIHGFVGLIDKVCVGFVGLSMGPCMDPCPILLVSSMLDDSFTRVLT